MEKVRQNLVHGSLAHDLLQGIEGLGSSFSYILVVVDQSHAHGGDENLLKVLQSIRGSGSDELTESDADTLLDIHVGRGLQAILEQGQQCGKDGLASLLDKVAKSVAGNNLLLHVGRSETANDELR